MNVFLYVLVKLKYRPTIFTIVTYLGVVVKVWYVEGMAHIYSEWRLVTPSIGEIPTFPRIEQISAQRTYLWTVARS